MRRLYVAPQAVHLEHKDIFCPKIGSHYAELLTYTNPSDVELKQSDPDAWEALPEVIAWRAAGSPILISTTLEHGEWQQDKWHNHPDVGILPNPVFEGNMSVAACADCPEHKFEQCHADVLSHLGVEPTDTVLQVSDKARIKFPNVKLSAIN